MKTINDIKVEKFRTNHVKDRLGNRQRISVPYIAKRKVKEVTGGLRFVHLLIDGFIVNLLYTLLDPILAYPNSFIFEMNDSVYMVVTVIAINLLIPYFIYYFLMEKFFQTTLGKLVTQSVVIDKYAKRPDDRSLVVRTLIRLIPFDVLSFLGERGWHDKWSETYVVKKEERDFLKNQLENASS